MDHLQDIFNRQVGLQKEAYGIDLEALAAGGGSEELAQRMKDNILALTDELHEALNEVGWKPWATSRHINSEAFRGEIVDALHFLVNLYVLGGGTAEDMYQKYCLKNNKNRLRQSAGYDGVKGKCPGCRRALDDFAVDCTDHGDFVQCTVDGTKYPV